MSLVYKKSQITIFLILGIVIIIMIAVFMVINRYSIKKTTEQEILSAQNFVFDVQPIKNFVQECLFIVSKESLEQNFEEESLQVQLENYVENNIDNCLDYSVFLEQGFDISKEEAAIEVNINKNDISFKMNYPFIISNPKSGEKTQIKDFLINHNLIQE